MKLARDKETTVLMLKAMREGFRALKTLGFPILPSELRYIERLPLWILTPLARRLLSNRNMKYVFAHGDAALKGLPVLERELTEIIRGAGIPTPAYDELTRYVQLTLSTGVA